MVGGGWLGGGMVEGGGGWVGGSLKTEKKNATKSNQLLKPKKTTPHLILMHKARGADDRFCLDIDGSGLDTFYAVHSPADWNPILPKRGIYGQ